MRAGGEQPRHAIQVDVELFEADVRVAHFWTLFQLPGTRMLLGADVLALLLALLGCVRALSTGAGPSWSVYVVLALVGAQGLLPLVVARRAKQFFDAMTDTQRKGQYLFHDDRFEWTLGREPGDAARAAVGRVAETSQHLFLVTRRGRTHALPKRCLGKGGVSAVLQWARESKDLNAG